MVIIFGRPDNKSGRFCKICTFVKKIKPDVGLTDAFLGSEASTTG